MIDQNENQKEALDQELNDSTLENVNAGNSREDHSSGLHVLKVTDGTPANEKLYDIMEGKETGKPDNH